jgi:hypothetical protein
MHWLLGEFNGRSEEVRRSTNRSKKAEFPQDSLMDNSALFTLTDPTLSFPPHTGFGFIRIKFD